MKRRCSWVDENLKIYVDYHDNEWGIPKYDDKVLFDFLVLEMFQAGLSWITILKKRKNFKKAFDNFNVKKICKYDKKKIDSLLKDEGIIRNRLKIVSTINNAKIFLEIKKEYKSFSNYIWHFTDNKIINNKGRFITSSPLSDASSKDLKKRGMRFVGTMIIYSYLQAIGIVNDHQKGCFKYCVKSGS